MIKSIIKRNGKSEIFSPSKVNGWGAWAAKTLGDGVDWGTIVLEAVAQCPEECTSLKLQETLIDVCLGKKTWEYNRMAGRLYIALLERKLYDGKRPTVKALHEKLAAVGLMVKLDYTDDEYEQVEDIIKHKRDLLYPHFQINQLRLKYALRNKVTGEEFETPQFVYMRMAMALAEKLPDRMTHIAKWYSHFSMNRLNAPTTNFTNLGTKLNGYASCCVYSSGDSAPSLAAGDHIAYMMTVMSAGIGSHIKTRSLKDPIRNGLISHQGKLPYYRALVGAIGANLQNGRGGAATVHYTAYDPEVQVIQKLRHPMTPLVKKIAGCHYSFGSNKFLARKVAKNEDYAPFSYYDNPDLYYAQYSGDQERFERLYAEHEKTATVKLSAREVVLGALTQAYETGVQYQHQTDTMNTHTPFLDPIFSSNLCQEIAIPSRPYKSVQELYSAPEQETAVFTCEGAAGDFVLPLWETVPANQNSRGRVLARDLQIGDTLYGNVITKVVRNEAPEIGLCTLAGVIVSNIESDEQYAEVAYYALLMIDVCIHKSNYVFPSLAHSAKSRMSAGVGILGLAHLMAKKDKKYDTVEGRNFLHQLGETHMWHLINASLKLSKERGVAPWMYKTKWPTGWLPIDTYEKRVDTLVTVGNQRDWESLRAQIIENGGIRNSVLVAHMPGESSTIAAGTTNGLYPIRELTTLKTNDTQVNRWAAPDGTSLGTKYQLAWDVKPADMIRMYAVMQKWTDQAISADIYAYAAGDVKISSSNIINDYLDIVKFGMKTRYYVNTNTSANVDHNTAENAVAAATPVETEESDCCKL